MGCEALSPPRGQYTQPAVTDQGRSSVALIFPVNVLAQSGESCLCGQVEFSLQGLELHFYAPKPRPDVRRDLLAEIPSTCDCACQQPDEQTQEYYHSDHRRPNLQAYQLVCTQPQALCKQAFCYIAGRGAPE